MCECVCVYMCVCVSCKTIVLACICVSGSQAHTHTHTVSLTNTCTQVVAPSPVPIGPEHYTPPMELPNRPDLRVSVHTWTPDEVAEWAMDVLLLSELQGDMIRTCARACMVCVLKACVCVFGV